MLPRILNKARLSTIPKLKSCKPNCYCSFRMKMILMKPPINIIDEAFIRFQIREHKEEYLKCYNTKINKK